MEPHIRIPVDPVPSDRCDPPVSAGALPSNDIILVSRQRLESLQRHLTCSYERFPTRHLRQSLQIIQHLLVDGDRIP
ncbi:MAG: hypothetical protein ACUVSY_16850 [Roseiflexus sp.]